MLSGKVLVHFGFESKVLPWFLTDICAWVGLCTSSPQQGNKYQLLIFGFLFGGVLYISQEKFPTSKFLPGPLTDLGAWVVFCTSSPQQSVKYQLCHLDIFFFFGGGLYISHEKFPMPKYLPT